MDPNLEKLIRLLAGARNNAEQVDAICRALDLDRGTVEDLVDLHGEIFDSVHTNKRLNGLASVGLGVDGRQAAHELGLLDASPSGDAEAVRDHLLSLDDGRGSISGSALDAALGVGSARLRDAVELLERDERAKAHRSMSGIVSVSLTALGRSSGRPRSETPRVDESSGHSETTPLPLADARFALAGRLGEGTAGEVYRAEDKQLGRSVALKFVTATRAGEDALAHARALARVAHANIVTVFEVSRLSHPTTALASSVVVMELVEGTPLAEAIGTPMSRETMLMIGRSLVDALGAYHRANLAHLDLHDGNVMVSGSSVKVLDPLYYDTEALRSTATRERQQSRDVGAVRDVLLQLVFGAATVGAIAQERANEFLRATALAAPSLDLLRTELEKAIASDGPSDASASTRELLTAPAVSAAREAVLSGTYERLRAVHRTTASLISLVQTDGPDERARVDGEKRRLDEHNEAWRQLQAFHLTNALYLGKRLDSLVNDYMNGIIQAVAGWQAGSRSRGRVHDWSNAVNGLKALGETTLEQITHEIRELLGLGDVAAAPIKPGSA